MINPMSDPARISWYRCKVDKAVMSGLMKRSDARGLLQVIPQLGLYALTGTLAYQAYLRVNAHTWPWAVPLVLLCLFLHGTNGSFFGGIACHELSHKTPFASPTLNAFFLRVYAFLAWFDPIGYRQSHIRHHQSTVYKDLDGEVVLPVCLDWHGIKFVLCALAFHPRSFPNLFLFWVDAARNRIRRDCFFRAPWLSEVLPESDAALRGEWTRWARFVLFGHLFLATVFVVSGHWFLVVVFTLGCQYSGWLTVLTGAAQHVGMSPNVPDFRLNSRTYTCGWLPAFLYWNMQYHVEHHMFPAVPFYNLPRLRAAIAHDLPEAPHGLIATWRQLWPIMKRQREDPTYVFVPKLPGNDGERVGDTQVYREAAQISPGQA